jgi:hypothetical protein
MRCHRDEDTIFAALSRKRNFCGKLGHLKQNMTQQVGPSSLRFIEKKNSSTIAVKPKRSTNTAK